MRNEWDEERFPQEGTIEDNTPDRTAGFPSVSGAAEAGVPAGGAAPQPPAGYPTAGQAPQSPAGYPTAGQAPQPPAGYPTAGQAPQPPAGNPAGGQAPQPYPPAQPGAGYYGYAAGMGQGGGYGAPPRGPAYPYYANFPQPPKKKSSIQTVIWCVAGVVVVAALGLLVFALTASTRQEREEEPSGSYQAESSFGEYSALPGAPKAKADVNGPQVSLSETPSGISSETDIAAKAYQKASPTVVCITSYTSGGDYTLDAEGEGSGIILTADGYIVTNAHVVNNSKKTGVMVTLSDNRQFLATIIGVDVKTDLAVIKIDGEDLPIAEFSDSSKVVVGQEVFAIGNPGGSAFSNSLTKGAVSAIDRVVSSGYVKYIQTDAAINPGNSGGALINEHGQVIGINAAKIAATEYEGMGFAIPSNTVLEIINKLIRYGYVNDRGTLSIEGKTCTLYMSKANHVPEGMLITKINDDSPLKKTSAKKDDIITGINGVTVKNSVEFIDELKKYGPGQSVKLTLYRVGRSGSTGKSFDVTVELIPDTGTK